MGTLTDKELQAMKVFIDESMHTCGTFDENGNMSWLNAEDLVIGTGLSKHQVAGVMSQLEAKALIVDSGESSRGSHLNDWFACDENARKYPQLRAYITGHRYAA